MVEHLTADMALRENENTPKDAETLTELVPALTRQVRRVDAELRLLRGGSSPFRIRRAGGAGVQAAETRRSGGKAAK